MVRVNEDYLKLPGSYLFSTIARKAAAYRSEHPDRPLISLGIGDVTQPLVPAIIDELHAAVDEMAHAETFHGYAPELGYEFLRSVIAQQDYQDRGCRIEADEIFETLMGDNVEPRRDFIQSHAHYVKNLDI